MADGRRKSVLVVDDEKNIRLTLRAALESIEVETDEAVNAEEALSKLTERPYDVVLLDLKMPGMGGMEALERIRRDHPGAKVVIITAHGSIDSAVKAMKMGAVDFLQKPFTPTEIRELVSDLLIREELAEGVAEEDYETHVDRARRAITDHASSEALPHVVRAIALRPDSAEAFNLLGIVNELHRRENSRKYYLVAVSLDPTYRPAERNLHRVVSGEAGKVDLGLPELEPPASAGPGAVPSERSESA